jgi:ADP-ribose pyrophosphatase
MTGGHAYEVRDRVQRFVSPVFTLYTDQVVMPGGRVAARDYLAHIGAVGVVAIDDSERVVLVRQYRHPVGWMLWELPAGLIDVAGEPLEQAAARELAEEADLVPGRLELLVDMHPSPGCSSEVIRLFLARDLREVPVHELHERRDEEAEMTVSRVPLDEAVAMALDGRITNGACLVGVLAAARLRDAGWPVPRPLDTPLARSTTAPLPTG